MAFEDDLFAHLQGDSTLVADVGDRVEPLVSSPASALPRLVYTTIFLEPDNDMDAASSMDRVRVQIDTYAASQTQARAVAAKVRARMRVLHANWRGAVLMNQADMPTEPATDERRVMQEFSVFTAG